MTKKRIKQFRAWKKFDSEESKKSKNRKYLLLPFSKLNKEEMKKKLSFSLFSKMKIQ